MSEKRMVTVAGVFLRPGLAGAGHGDSDPMRLAAPS